MDIPLSRQTTSSVPLIRSFRVYELSKYSLFICSFTYWLNFNRVTCDLHNYDKLSRVYFKDYKSINLSKYSFDHLSSYSFICSFTYWLFLFQLRDL